jgi:hypothetical protein
MIVNLLAIAQEERKNHNPDGRAQLTSGCLISDKYSEHKKLNETAWTVGRTLELEMISM